jgi:hypothetical protein
VSPFFNFWLISRCNPKILVRAPVYGSEKRMLLDLLDTEKPKPLPRISVEQSINQIFGFFGDWDPCREGYIRELDKLE